MMLAEETSEKQVYQRDQKQDFLDVRYNQQWNYQGAEVIGGIYDEIKL